jgi:hypothetical protein
MLVLVLRLLLYEILRKFYWVSACGQVAGMSSAHVARSVEQKWLAMTQGLLASMKEEGLQGVPNH